MLYAVNADTGEKPRSLEIAQAGNVPLVFEFDWKGKTDVSGRT
jgi:hypothetical protein